MNTEIFIIEALLEAIEQDIADEYLPQAISDKAQIMASVTPDLFT